MKRFNIAVVQSALAQEFDAFEIEPIHITPHGDEPCEESDADYWSVFVHLTTGGVECIADCQSCDDAEQLVWLLEAIIKNQRIKV